MFIKTQTNGNRTYLLLVENTRVNGRVVQRVHRRLGRLDKLRASGELDGILKSVGHSGNKLAALDAHARGESVLAKSVSVGRGLILERLWRECGIADALTSLLAARRFTFPVERAIFETVLRRLIAPGDDRAAERCRHDHEPAGGGALKIHHVARAMAWLGELVPPGQQGTPGTTKDRIEGALFAPRRHLFSRLDLVIVDAKAMYAHGAGGTMPGNGDSRDRASTGQMVVGMVLDGDGHSVGTEVWAGSTTEETSLIPAIERLRQRFGVQEIRVVADRSAIGAGTLGELLERGCTCIVGVRLRSSKNAQRIADADGGDYHTVVPQDATSTEPVSVRAKQVGRAGHRYTMCLSVDQATQDRDRRETVVTALGRALAQGDRSLLRNKEFCRFLKADGTRFEIDDAKVAADARCDGTWLLRTSDGLGTDELALAYAQLWTAGTTVGSMHSAIDTRPLYLQKDETIRGHMVCSFLALVVRQELERRLELRGWRLDWADIVRDLDQLTETAITVHTKSYVLRSEITSTLRKVFRAAGVALPPVLRSRPLGSEPASRAET